MTSDSKDQPKTLKEALAVIENQKFAIECSDIEKNAMAERLTLLRCHKVYVFFAKDGRMSNVGQDRGSAKSRIYEHLKGATRKGTVSFSFGDLCLFLLFRSQNGRQSWLKS